VEDDFYDNHKNGNGKAWGGVEPTTHRKRNTLNNDASGPFGRKRMPHLTEDEITGIETKTASDVMELESDFDVDKKD
jgi:hypothetical protein